LLKAGYVGLEGRLLSNYPCSSTCQAIQSTLDHSSTCQDLVKGIQQGRWTAEDVMRVVCLKALESHREYNCITEQFMLDALDQAMEHDMYFRSTGQLKGPLHGIPIALKDDIDVKGVGKNMSCLI
jgi:Asp-tRNA(Asn)/Glu-tRNA(Gln) amidotransferase A subunit family amidase